MFGVVYVVFLAARTQREGTEIHSDANSNVSLSSGSGTKNTLNGILNKYVCGYGTDYS